MTAALTISNLRTTHAASGFKLNVPHLTVDSGEALAIVGPSGAGKSTFLHALAGLIPIQTGVISIAGHEITHRSLAGRDVSLMFQTDALFPHLTVGQNVAFPLRARGVSSQERKRIATTALQDVELSEYAQRAPATLSGGQRQRAALARSLVLTPRVLLLDEPFANLDAPLRRGLRDQILHLQVQRGFALLIVMHDVVEAASIAERILVLEGGEVAGCGAARDFYWEPPSRLVAELFGVCNWLARDADGNLKCGCNSPERACWLARPEAISVVTTRGDDTLEATVRSVRCVGAHWAATFGLVRCGHTIAASFPAASWVPTVKSGDHVFVRPTIFNLVGECR